MRWLDADFVFQVSKAILGDKKPLTTRPSAALPPADFAAVKTELDGKYGGVLGEITDELVVSHLLYPKVCKLAPAATSPLRRKV